MSVDRDADGTMQREIVLRYLLGRRDGGSSDKLLFLGRLDGTNARLIIVVSKARTEPNEV